MATENSVGVEISAKGTVAFQFATPSFCSIEDGRATPPTLKGDEDDSASESSAANEIGVSTSKESETSEAQKGSRVGSDPVKENEREATNETTENPMATENGNGAQKEIEPFDVSAPTEAMLPSPSPSPSIQTRECDYDDDPSPLYKAVEAKQWDRVIQLCEERPILASTWVLRKEHDGRLRWRLLPLHAAIIFGAPFSVVEALLSSFPQSAMCKDDQGMLPLHLALRNTPIQFNTVEELLTVHPAAVYVPDRKQRTPLEGGLVATGGKEKNSALSVLELYTQITAAGEKQRWRLAHEREAQQRMEAAQQQFQAEKGALQEIHKKALQHANDQHVKEVVKLQEQVRELGESNRKLREQKIELENQKTAGMLASAGNTTESNPKKERPGKLKVENEALQEMVQLLLAQQSSLRQALEVQEQRAVEQDAARQLLWQQLITHQHESRTTTRKSTKEWIEELRATESSIKTALDHIREVSSEKKTRKLSENATAASSVGSVSSGGSHDIQSNQTKKDLLEKQRGDSGMDSEDEAELNSSLQVD